MNHLYFLNPHCLLYYAQFISTALYCSHMPCPATWAVISLCLYKPIFKISLSLFPFLPQAVTSSSCTSSSTGVCAPSPWDSWAQLLLFLDTFTKPFPISPLWVSHELSHLTPFCSPLSPDARSVRPLSIGASLMLSVFCILPPLLLPTFSYQVASTTSAWIHCLYFPISSPKTLQILFYQHIICLSFHFFLKPFLGG